jgi:sterol desaturase/sphingolipid hydroxylase (fatty acid hydroxylase superfamily)
VLDDMNALATFVIDIVWLLVEPLFWSALAFALLAFALKGRGALEAARRAARQTRITLALYLLDLLLVGPPLALAIGLIARTLNRYSLVMTPDWMWAGLGPVATLTLTIFAGDFTSYWRHRLEHTRWLWPTHAIHHSDTEMTWLTGNRFHPVNRLVTTVVDNTALALLGAPPWAIAVNELIRHSYGEFVHADLPWTYGPLGAIFVSPAMHRWHHARDVTGAGSNFATVFSIFDRLFGTLHLPGPCRVPLGVTDDIGPGAVGQLTYPFRSWARDALDRNGQASEHVVASLRIRT